MKKFRDIIFYTFIGLLFGGFVILTLLIYMPYFLGREIWLKVEEIQAKEN
tara:strand:+ start:331 stop:480 length:150 start_codon:yes stop_codon:yes gene_type:complete